MIVGIEWLIEATNCNADKLRDVTVLQNVFARVIADLELKIVGEQLWHKFPSPGAGVTGLVMLTESHLACHTYPESQIATFNLYCCRARPEWNWAEHLQNILEAKNVSVTEIERGSSNADILSAVPSASRSKHSVLENLVIKPKFKNISIRQRRLPHLEREDGIYFVTFRLADSLPQNVLEKIKLERTQAQKVLENSSQRLSKSAEKRISVALVRKIEKCLDAGAGVCHLSNPQIAEIVATALKFHDGRKYRLFAWCVMPNHVHIVVKPNINHELAEILHSLKSFTANEANKILKRSGEFWQREYYDHLIRNDEEFYRVIKYVEQNPTNAGLKNWNWVEVLTADKSETHV